MIEFVAQSSETSELQPLRFSEVMLFLPHWRYFRLVLTERLSPVRALFSHVSVSSDVKNSIPSRLSIFPEKYSSSMRISTPSLMSMSFTCAISFLENFPSPSKLSRSRTVRNTLNFSSGKCSALIVIVSATTSLNEAVSLPSEFSALAVNVKSPEIVGVPVIISPLSLRPPGKFSADHVIGDVPRALSWNENEVPSSASGIIDVVILGFAGIFGLSTCSKTISVTFSSKSK